MFRSIALAQRAVCRRFAKCDDYYNCPNLDVLAATLTNSHEDSFEERFAWLCFFLVLSFESEKRIPNGDFNQNHLALLIRPRQVEISQRNHENCLLLHEQNWQLTHRCQQATNLSMQNRGIDFENIHRLLWIFRATVARGVPIQSLLLRSFLFQINSTYWPRPVQKSCRIIMTSWNGAGSTQDEESIQSTFCKLERIHDLLHTPLGIKFRRSWNHPSPCHQQHRWKACCRHQTKLTLASDSRSSYAWTSGCWQTGCIRVCWSVNRYVLGVLAKQEASMTSYARQKKSEISESCLGFLKFAVLAQALN